MSRRRNSYRIAILVLYVVFAVKTWLDKPAHGVDQYGNAPIGGDFVAYYQAAQGKYETVWPQEYQPYIEHGLTELGGKADYMYPHWTAKAWTPFLIMDIEPAYIVWYGLQTIATLFLIWKITGIKYGWLFALAGIKIFIFNWQTGNVAPILAALSVTTLGAICSSWLKPYYVIPALVRIFRYLRNGHIGDATLLRA